LEERDLKEVGFKLSQQRDPDLPKTFFPSGYIPDPWCKAAGTTRKKAGMK